MDLQFSDEPLNIEQDFNEWEPAPEFAPPPQAGTYTVYIDQIRSEEQFEVPTVGVRYKVVVDLRIVGGEYDNRTITWQRFSNKEVTRKATGKRSSQLLDLVKAAGMKQPPRSNNDFHLVVNRLKDLGPGATFMVQIDWRGFCTPCFEKKLMELTHTATPDDAKHVADGDQRNEASNFATKARNYRGFPVAGVNQRKDSFICEGCKNEVRAQVQIQRFLAPVA